MACAACAAGSLWSCGSSNENTDGGDSSSGSDASNGDAWVPPVARGACAAPTITSAHTVSCDGGCGTARAALSWSGTEAALAYYEGPTVQLQRLTPQGQPIGQSIYVGDAQNYQLSLGVATDGSVYVVCWSEGEHIDCVSVFIASGKSMFGFMSDIVSIGGSVAYGIGGFAVAFKGTVQPLNADATANGSPVAVSTMYPDSPVILPTPSGYVVGLTNFARVFQLSPTFDVLGSVDLLDAQTLYGFGVSGSTVGIDWTSSNIVEGVVQAAGAFVIGTDAGCSSSGWEMSAAGAASSFAFTWRGDDTTLHYRAYDDKGTALGPEVSGSNVGGDCKAFPYPGPLASVAVSDGFLVADSSSGAIGITHIACP